jgi:hypothetical protein
MQRCRSHQQQEQLVRALAVMPAGLMWLAVSGPYCTGSDSSSSSSSRAESLVALGMQELAM